ncbi:CoA-binding protein [Pseudarthrobacter sp. NPDC080039]|uniref:acetate--CoA ligase family protein n=1 Tax=unclassified Pseudarthrobacter TaxID=2647000 RepID=UPI00344C49D2
MTSAADLFFRPRSVVVYGASSNPDKLSGRPLAYLLKFGFPGKVYAVNSHRNKVQGVDAYQDIASVPGPVDLAVIVVPAVSVLDAVRRCADSGVGAATIFASGFAETGDTGMPLQEEISRISRSSGMRVLGPNCLGTFSAPDKAFATFSTAFDDESERPDSPIALVSQSGAVGTFTYTTMNSLGLGARFFANTGNESDLTSVEILSGLVENPAVDILMGHIEGAKDLDALTELAKAASSKDKPLLLLKSGRTTAGARAVAKHTGSIAGDDGAFNSALAPYGAVRVESLQAWSDAALAFSDGRRAAGRRLTIVTLSGGVGALAADRAVELGLTVDTWTDSRDRKELAAELPSFASVANPIDMTGAMINDLDLLDRALRVTSENAETDALMLILGNADKGAEEIVKRLVSGYRSTTKPFVVVWTGGSGRPLQKLLKAGVPAYAEADRALGALSRVVEFSLRPVLAVN